MVQAPFITGVNYWPRKKAMYWWKDFDRAEVEAEFSEIAALKLQVARIFFQHISGLAVKISQQMSLYPLTSALLRAIIVT